MEDILDQIISTIRGMIPEDKQADFDAFIDKIGQLINGIISPIGQ